MKTKDYIKVKLVEDIEKLTTQKSFCIKRTSDHSVMVEGIKISFNIINYKWNFNYMMIIISIIIIVTIIK